MAEASLVMAGQSKCPVCLLTKDEDEFRIAKKGALAGGCDLRHCSLCIRLNTRLKRLDDRDAVEVFRSQAPARRAEFMATHHQTLGEDLKKVLTEFVSEEVSETTSTQYQGQADWLDEDDLNTRFVKKPLQLQSVLQHARTMFDATRNVKLYEVFTYKTNCNNGTESTTKASRTLEANQNIKGNARPKAPRQIAEEPAEEDPDAPKELTFGQTRKYILRLSN
jgi:hypothetical protein